MGAFCIKSLNSLHSRIRQTRGGVRGDTVFYVREGNRPRPVDEKRMNTMKRDGLKNRPLFPLIEVFVSDLRAGFFFGQFVREGCL